jgi:hypothetical protein
VAAVRIAAAGFHIAVAAEVEAFHNSAEVDYRAAAADILGPTEAVERLDTAIPDREVVVLLAEMVLESHMAGMGVAGMTSGTEAVVLGMAIVRVGET